VTESKLGPIWLQAGVTPRNALTFFYSSFFTVGMLSFMSFMQPYVINENLQIPVDAQGGVTAMLHFSYEFVLLLLIAPVGALSDKIGRRTIYRLGFLWVGVALVIFPLAQNMTQLVMGRMFFAVGAAMITGMMATVLADYPQDRSRGKMVAGVGIANGAGAVTVILLMSRLPAWFADMGYSTLMSGRFTYWVAASLCVVTAIIVGRGLQAGKPGKPKERQHIGQLLNEGLQAARQNPRIGVACLAAFVARGDVAMIATYFSLWASQAGLAEGLTLEEAIGKAAMFIAIVQVSSLVWAPIWGVVLDRIDRLTAVTVGMGLAAVAYIWVGFSPSPIAVAFIPAAIFLGIGEFSAMLAGAALIGQEAPVDIRGSVLGVFNLCGSIGILCVTLLAGYIFDAWMPGGAFIAVGLINLAVCAIAFTVRRKVGYRSPHGDLV
jgi:MFS family permease